jgi:putative peptidoglycan lipid II flippase
MLSRIATVGGLTLVSRITGFLPDIMLAAILGAGPVADAFFIALRLPNYFRAIFAEGAFNAAFVPAYARIRGERSGEPARLFADRVFTMLPCFRSHPTAILAPVPAPLPNAKASPAHFSMR